MNIKTFKDGDRFIVVFEGLENSPSNEAMIQGILASIIGTTASVEKVDNAIVEPVPTKEEEVPEIPFTSGYFEGKTRTEALEYLRKRFVNTNADEYANKLSDSQRIKFFKTFADVIPEGMDDVATLIKMWQSK